VSTLFKSECYYKVIASI